MMTIKQRRTALGLTQQELARRANCSMSYVRMVDFRPPDYQLDGPAPTLKRIIAALDKAEKEAT